MLEEKNIQSKKYLLGQFFTPADMVQDIVNGLDIDADVIVEPSFGLGAFLGPLKSKFAKAKIVGVELDTEWFDQAQPQFADLTLHNKNFYDVDQELVFESSKVHFVGNVPFRSPAYSLTTHKNYVKKLAHRYGVTGIREEAVFFIIKTADIMLQNGYNGGIHYIIPKSLITNNSKFYTQFKQFLKRHFKIQSVTDVDPGKFDNVAQGLIMLSMISGGDQSNYDILHNAKSESVDSVLQLQDSAIPFQQIFKKTYLGSVPAESFLLSVSGETKEQFRDRLVRMFSQSATKNSLRIDLAHKGRYHLKILSSKDQSKVDVKLEQIADYVNQVRRIVDVGIFAALENYKPIQHRKETRYYFRHTAIRKCSFVYELNPNPCPSFYFTSNPSDGSTDYFGYCDYDITRNSSPGCCRTVPVSNIADNVHDSFKQYWLENLGVDYPIELVFSYIRYVAGTAWYRQQKKIRKRFYFCLPQQFDRSWLSGLDIKLELSLIKVDKGKHKVDMFEEVA